MARPLRVNLPEGWYHCMNRGIERRSIFVDARDYKPFVALLGETVERYRFRIHAYCLMRNHYHAIIQTPDANLSEGMQWLELSYSRWFNTRRDRVGPLFQGRFKSVPVEDGSWAHELSLYVHLNPVRTAAYGLDRRRRKAESKGLGPPPTPESVTARLKRLREYRWSSYRAYGGYETGPEWLTTTEILGRRAAKKSERRKAYRRRLREVLSQGVDESRLERFRDVVGIGSAEFIVRIKARAGSGTRETERRRLRDRVSFEEVIRVVEHVRGHPRGEWISRHGDWGKWLVLKLARQRTGLTLAELGEKMGGSDYAAVSVGLKRFDTRLRKDRRIKALHNRALTMLNV